MNIIDAIKGRKSYRAFLAKDVDNKILYQVLEAARFAPSGTNTQPWHVNIVKGETKKKITDAILLARKNNQAPNPDYEYYPTQWIDPYKSRRFACGMALYGALDIKREDTEKRQRVWDLNYQFFGAPVGILITIDDILEQGSWFDLGMFFQNLMLGLREYGLESCPQASLAEYPDIVREILNIEHQQKIVCGLSVGYPDKSKPINQYQTEREAVDSFTAWFCD